MPHHVLPMILAGGLGTRLRSVAGDVPKPLVPVRGRPFLTRLLEQLAAASCTRAVLCTGYGADLVEQTLGRACAGIALRYSRESVPLGTAGALRLALASEPAQQLLVMNGDSYCHLELDAFLSSCAQRGWRSAMVLTPVEDCSRYGRVDVGPGDRVSGFAEKQDGAVPGRINAGIYLLDAAVIHALPPDREISLEREVMPALLEGGLYAYPCHGPFIDIGTPESLARADAFFRGLDSEVGRS